MPKRIYILIIILLLVNIITCKAKVDNNIPLYGLTFRSHTVNQDERTSFDLTSEGSLNFPSGFTIEFDLRLTREEQSYGYVFRIVSSDTTSLDLLTNLNIRKLNFVLVSTQSVLANSDFKIPDEIKEGQWMKIKVRLDKKKIVCGLDGTTRRILHSFKNFRNIKIYFGMNKHHNFCTTDVPPMSIRNLIIRNEKGQIIRKWDLAKHNINEVYDEIANKKAVVGNGIWEIDKRIRWSKIGSLFFKDQSPQIATDKLHGRIFVATDDSLYTFHIINGEVHRVKINKGAPFRSGGSTMVYDQKNDRLISYSIMYPDFVIYNFSTNEWSDQLRETLPPIQQHNRFIDEATNQLILFGGYGNHRYHAELARHNLDGGKWQIDTLSSVFPRYLSAMGYLGNGKLLIMGGYGSHSGNQEESPKNFYDLYEVDSKSLKCRKLADFPIEKEPRALGNSMVIEKSTDKVYTLSYNNYRYHSAINLLCVDLNTMEQTILADPIPYNFFDTKSFCDLFLYNKTSSLYAIVSQEQSSDLHSVSFYSLAYPPLETSAVLQLGEFNSILKRILIYSAIGIIILTLLLGSFYFYRKKKKGIAKEENKAKEHTISTNSETIIEQEKPALDIHLLGGFQIFNKQGEDITGSFTLVIKQMFLLLLLNSIRDGKGVTSQKLDETFWFGMDKANASNNRSVNVRKLRLLLQEAGNITLLNENSYWYLKIGKDVTCDYYSVMNLLKKLKQESLFDIKLLEQIIDLASAGMLLPNTNTEWVDDFKSGYSTMLLDLLLRATNQPDIQKDPRLLVKISDIMLLHDNINDDAIRMKCRALYQLGQKGQSKHSFDKFYAEYIHLLNTKPDFEYEDIIRN